MTYNVSVGTLIPIHSLTHSLTLSAGHVCRSYTVLSAASQRNNNSSRGLHKTRNNYADVTMATRPASSPKSKSPPSYGRVAAAAAPQSSAAGRNPPATDVVSSAPLQIPSLAGNCRQQPAVRGPAPGRRRPSRALATQPGGGRRHAQRDDQTGARRRPAAGDSNSKLNRFDTTA